MRDDAVSEHRNKDQPLLFACLSVFRAVSEKPPAIATGFPSQGFFPYRDFATGMATKGNGEILLSGYKVER